MKRFLLILCLLVLMPGCHRMPAGEGFAIYLTKDDILPAQMEALSHVELADQPVISSKDIVTYYAQTHEIKLTPEAFERVAKLKVPVQGKSFLVCIDKSPVYWGAFWTPVSSISFDGVTIWQPRVTDEPMVITLELGYPASSFYQGGDPRANPAILAALEEAGKLVLKQSITSIEALPRSMKGYELYSWFTSNEWHFTLITGTNRNKTWQEIVSGEDLISQSGWIKTHVVGENAIKAVLGKIPRREFITWLDGGRLAQSVEPSVDMRLPPTEVVESIKNYAASRGLELSVAAH